MFPNEARLRNMTYGFSIHYDIEVDFKIIDQDIIDKTITLDKIYLGRFPIMLHSNMCILNKLKQSVQFEMGECLEDNGGYFIIDGKEKIIICQEKFANNMLYSRENYSDMYNYSVEIKSASEDASKPIRTTAVRMVTPNEISTNNNIVVTIPNVRKPIPFFIVMRALGIISDKEIIKYTIFDLKKNINYLEDFRPSIHDAGKIFTQELSIKYIATFTKGKTAAHVLQILSDFFLPHIGEMNYHDKAYFLGHMVFKLLKLSKKEEAPTDRDNFKYKRVEMTGSLIYGLFKEYYSIMQKRVYQKIDKEYYYHEGQYQGPQFTNLIENNYKEYFKEREVEMGFKKAFKGNWGAEAHTKRPGVIQDLNRLSYNSALSQKRKINLPLDSSAKVVGPRLLHSSQWGIIDPLDTPDGGNIGLHKHMAIAAKITDGYSSNEIIELLKKTNYVKFLNECVPEIISKNIQLFVNGSWIGITSEPIKLMIILKFYKKIAVIPVYTSISWYKTHNTIEIYTDEGRMCRPVFYIDTKDNSLSLKQTYAHKKLKDDDFTWNELIYGFNKTKKVISDKKVTSMKELYDETDANKLSDKQAIIEYVDCSEEDVAYISSQIDEVDFKNKSYTHADIHPSLILGVMGNQIIFPENNQLPRNLFSCGQSKQAVSLYHTNYQNRIDKMGVILNYGQTPLVKSRYLKYINDEKHPYGENAIVAIMCYGGYNVEDSILFNKGSIDRGLFRTTYFNSYEAREESTKVRGSFIDSKFTNIEKENVVGLKPGYDYSYLDEYGLIKEDTYLNDKITLIGKANANLEDPNKKLDSSVYPKKGQLGYVDKSFMTDGEEGFRLAKVRIREERIPNIGDKFCSRCGQKGTIGQIIREEDMPFTQNGIKPDIIVNPHAFPSRMTIGQLVEVITGKVGVNYGAYGDCTAFLNKGEKNKLLGDLLTKVGYNSTGNELLYNGETGEQLDSTIFIGPTYYMRLKHMVKDKINYRARGPRTLLTRQTVQGRANDGGLRIGEMERDGIIAHGASAFLQDSMLNRGDEFYMAICNNSGTIAIYNESKNLFLSPMSDGPIKFDGEIDEKLSIINISKYGRDFSIVRVPYAFKLLMQELATMNVNMRIITDKNVDQLTSMSYSKNINVLLNDENITPKMINEQNVKLRDGMQTQVPKDYSGYFVKAPEQPQPTYDSPEYMPESPAYVPYSPEYGPKSPAYVPTYDSPEYMPEYPAYVPTHDSPESGSLVWDQDERMWVDRATYVPNSPGYVPTSPSEINPMFVSQVKYKEGETVNFSLDNNKEREWTIKNINNETGDFVLTTKELNSLPDFAIIGKDTSIATVLATKLQIQSIKSSEEKPLSSNGISPLYSQRSPIYHPVILPPRGESDERKWTVDEYEDYKKRIKEYEKEHEQKKELTLLTNFETEVEKNTNIEKTDENTENTENTNTNTKKIIKITQ